MSASKTAADIRQAFLNYFGRHNHQIVRSSSLIPSSDPTLQFVNAGMVQFKNVFTGEQERSFPRATSSQKCIRISGKHNDLENVGRTARHHTFFEMLGNFSFGDYFKEDAIAFAWELLTKDLGIPEERLAITVFGGEHGIPADDEAREIWKKVTGLGDDRILGMGMKDNFWQMGDTGPCGPCSEIHYYVGDKVNIDEFGEEPDLDGRGWMEIWNLVFMQFNREIIEGEPRLTPLPAKSVDTGAGLERLAAVLQGVQSNYDTDLLAPLVSMAGELAGKQYTRTQQPDDVSMRVIADHARTTAFLIAEGILPDRDGRSYVLRRVMRRAIRHGHRLGISKPFLHKVALKTVDLMREAYPELQERRELIESITKQEEVRFRATLDRGLTLLENEFTSLQASHVKQLSGETAFRLYDTFGFPLDLTQVLCEERGLSIDRQGYDQALASARERSAGSKVGDEAINPAYRQILGQLDDGTVVFTGYDEEQTTGVRVVALLRKGNIVDELNGDGEVVLDRTCLYGQSGGQVGDTGTLHHADGTLAAQVSNTTKPLPGLFVHRVTTSIPIKVGAELQVRVDHDRRAAIRRNHSATHLLHYALRTVLGAHAQQKGSLVGPERLRFDFTHHAALTSEQIERVEEIVNEHILANAPVETKQLPIEEAQKSGAMAIFEEKYGDVVRVVSIGEDSKELCGGTHVKASGDIGLFKVLSEGGIAAGVRRVEAVTGMNSLTYLQQIESSLRATSQILKTEPEDIADRASRLLKDNKQLEKEIEQLQRKLAMGGGGAKQAQSDPTQRWETDDFGPIAVLASVVDVADPRVLRDVCDAKLDTLGGEGVVALGAKAGPKAVLVVKVTKKLSKKVRAGDLVRHLAKIVGGAGGGRPDMAQAGGSEPDKLPEALQLETVTKLVRDAMS